MSLLSHLASQPDTGEPTTISVMVNAPTEPPCGVNPAAVTADDLTRCAATARFLCEALFGDEHSTPNDLARLGAGVDEHVDVWTPAIHATSRHELVATLERVDDAISEVDVTFSDSVEGNSTVLLTWLATGRFSRPAFLDDDQLLEPTGAVIRVAGATSVTFSASGRATRIRCYYDRLSVIEQLIAPHVALSGG